jgi:HNH endonuclease
MSPPDAPDKPTCSVPGCEGLSKTLGLCNAHYMRLQKHGDVLADKPVLVKRAPRRVARALVTCASCLEQFTRQRHEQRYCGQRCANAGPMVRVLQYGVKPCAWCGKSFTRYIPDGPKSRAVWEAQRCCSREHAKQAQRVDLGPIEPGTEHLSPKRRYQRIWERSQRQARAQARAQEQMPGWAAYWEEQRRAEDAWDGRTLPVLWQGHRVVQARGAVLVPKGKRKRTFVAGNCPDCGDPNVVVRHRWFGSIRCLECTERYWRRHGNHQRRAQKQSSKVLDIVVSEVVFRRDGYRCQICKRKTHGKFPHPRSPTVDHIVPLAQGGDHSYLNVQCACFECNWKKGDRAANDQLRLIS